MIEMNTMSLATLKIVVNSLCKCDSILCKKVMMMLCIFFRHREDRHQY